MNKDKLRTMFTKNINPTGCIEELTDEDLPYKKAYIKDPETGLVYELRKYKPKNQESSDV